MFNTTTNEKAADSKLDIYIFYLEEQEINDDWDEGYHAVHIASKEKIGGNWKGQSSNKIKLDILVPGLDLEQHNDAELELRFYSNNGNTWQFDFILEIEYVDEAGKTKKISKEYKNQRLSQFSYKIEKKIFE